jgi:thymidylate synthase
MIQLTYQDPRWALYKLAQGVINSGSPVAPRGIPTRELTHVTLSFLNTTACLPIGMGRNFNPKLAAVEALSLIGGFAQSEMLTAASPNFNDFTGGSPTGAYGPRLARQLPVIAEMLRDDPDTRQAVAMIWNPETDLFRVHGDRPCTTEIRFMIRDNLLITNTLMRSQDVYLGLPYDLVMFSTLHNTMANVLGVGAGDLIHQVQSLHVYERDLDKVSRLSAPPPVTSDATTLLHGLRGDSWDVVANRARLIAYHELRGVITPTDRWFASQMKHVRAKMIENVR